MNTPFIFHEDPGHGWLEVPIADLAAVGLSIGDFSGYSYGPARHLGGSVFFVYLEEDCDAAHFNRAYAAKHGKQPEYTRRYSDPCFVRDLLKLPRNDNAASMAPFRREG